MSTETTPGPEVMYDRAEVAHMDDQEEGPVTIHGAWYVVAGEYLDDTPDLVIRVEHAVDVNGEDVTEHVARKIAGLVQKLETVR